MSYSVFQHSETEKNSRLCRTESCCVFSLKMQNIVSKLPFGLILVVTSVTIASADIVRDLLTLQSQSPSGVIHLNDNLTTHLASSANAPRSFFLLVLFNALHLHDDPKLHLKDLQYEFNILASSYILNNHVSDTEAKIFFCDIEFMESQASFILFGVNSVPHIRLVAPNVLRLRDSQKIDQDKVDFSRFADSMVKYIEAETGLVVGPIHHPPILSKMQLALLSLVLVAMTPFVVKKVTAGNSFLHNKKLWMLGSLFVYYFSVSGVMHTIIRQMPMFMADRSTSKLIFFYPGSDTQLGAEGFAVGCLYTIVGLLMAFVTHVAVRVKSKNMQTLLLLSVLAISIWAVTQVVHLNIWKKYGSGADED